MDINKVNSLIDQLKAEVNSVPVTTRLARIDRNVSIKPSLPTIGPANSSYNDPVFFSKITRITDEKSHPEGYAVSFRTPGASPQLAWNADSTIFYVESTWGEILLYSWDGVKRTFMTKVNIIEPTFSMSNPDYIYGNLNAVGRLTLGIYSISGNKYQTLIDLSTIIPPSTSNERYISGVYAGGTYLATSFGGTQDLMPYVIRYNLNDGKYNLMNLNTRLGCNAHAAAIDKSGKYVIVYPAGAGQIGSIGIRIAPAYVWDVVLDTIKPITNINGHQVCGNEVAIDNQSLTIWDPAQWTLRQLNDPVNSAKEIINPVLRPAEYALADHQNMSHWKLGVGSLSGTYRYKRSDIPESPWRAWDDEIIGINYIGNTVLRFGHHRSNVYKENGADGLEFWATPRPSASPNGKYALFTSNMERTLGVDSVEKIARQDVFLVELGY